MPEHDLPATKMTTSSAQRKVSEARFQRPMFGGNLRDAIDRETGVSQFVVWCVDAVETTGDNLKTDALYRASGNQSKVQEIAATVRKNFSLSKRFFTIINYSLCTMQYGKHMKCTYYF